MGRVRQWAPLLVLITGCADALPHAEDLAEAEFFVTVTNTADPDAIVATTGELIEVAFSPGVWAVQAQAEFAVFGPGSAATQGQELLAETGDVGDLLREIATTSESRGVFGGDSESSYGDQPILPGESVSFGFRAVEGQALSLATMFGQSNDTVAATPDPVALFDESGGPLSGPLSISYLDAGTEHNEELGVGDNQAPRQAQPGDGQAEGGVVTGFGTTDAQGYVFPPLASVLTIEIHGTVVIEE